MQVYSPYKSCNVYIFTRTQIVFDVYLLLIFTAWENKMIALSFANIIYGHLDAYSFSVRNPGPTVRNLGQHLLKPFEHQDNNKRLIR